MGSVNSKINLTHQKIKVYHVTLLIKLLQRKSTEVLKPHREVKFVEKPVNVYKHRTC